MVKSLITLGWDIFFYFPMQLLFVLGLIEFTFHVGGGREVGRRAVAYARRQIVQIVGLTIPKKKKIVNLIKCLIVGDVTEEEEFSHQKQGFRYGRHQRCCMRNTPILIYKAPWDSLNGKCHINTSIFIAQGRSQIVDISAETIFQQSTGYNVLMWIWFGCYLLVPGLQPTQRSTPLLVPPSPLLKFHPLPFVFAGVSGRSSLCLCSHRLQYWWK